MSTFDLPQAPEWMSNALCAQIGEPEAWFPTGQTTPGMARRICRGCDVQVECLEYALEHREVGIWGATSERQRRRMRAGGGKSA